MKLRKTRFDLFEQADWGDYYAQMTPWLTHECADIRKMCVERLAAAVFWAEMSGPLNERPPHAHAMQRTQWFLEQIEFAHEMTQDTIALLLRDMRYHWPDRQAAVVVEAWLKKLAADLPVNVGLDVITGTLLVNKEPSRTTMQSALSLLDDPSDYLRACAAKTLSGADEELTGFSEKALFDLIKAKDIARPGVAGPFWSEWHFDCHDAPVEPMAWMMEILEKRIGDEPDMPFSGIDFYLHEVCDYSPENVQHMLDLGHVGLALETATEMHGPVNGMAPILKKLGDSDNKEIAGRAHVWLASYYAHVHQAASRQQIVRLTDFKSHLSEVCDVIAIRYGDTSVRCEGVVVYLTDSISSEAAWDLLMQAEPKTKQGAPVDLNLLKQTVEPAFTLQDKTIWQWDGGVRVTLQKTHGSGWRRLHLIAPRLGCLNG